MSENLYNSAHKGTSQAFRQGYDKIKWGDVSENPMVAIHGKGPEGKTCGECLNFFCIAASFPYVEMACLKRLANLPHSRHWPACGLWKERGC